MIEAPKTYSATDPTRCSECDETFAAGDLVPVRSKLFDAGMLIAIGDCPDCGSFCYPQWMFDLCVERNVMFFEELPEVAPFIKRAA